MKIYKEMMPVISRLFCNGAAINRPFRILARNWHREAIKVTWEKPEEGWTKLNYDGSCKGKTGKCSIGGIFRDHNADFLLGYAESIGQSNSTIAELAALLRGLEIVRENGWSDVWLEGDSKSLVDIIAGKREVKCTQVQMHVDRINLIVPEIKNCIITHIYREGNRAADKFALIGHQLKKPQVWRNIPPHQIMRIMKEDAQGKTFLRRR
ncbi:hypothetical protein MIMGU_mgv1a013877mg [Erythranthe guttata]|uniref:RNase H type-1 domain-containing protein n=1 Tax=Erythranthe guttata TaxID=4155 RepID=A0A022QJY2_ERYGU|nr:hypothetical protein MIMGU_mgv1a013877mg [Erythranthe guttata]